ncbi:DUF6143 family protein [Clostridium uliginosum]|uniref:Uncharacterized protein n=1 Tax=Clostridium uliginosum TaxID=119641 RepID=A0A1I1RQM1_9CLOT|nr:DUF6143 family protein [Clostridium uliginosum]SFD36631.1 hypothetical protein SAMN05421842_13719 [Clostridium uliginosum]
MYYHDKKIRKEVSVPYALYQSEKGEYFIGQTPILIGQDQHALAELVNPITSNVNIYVNAIAVTNISELNLSSEFYLKSTLNGGIISNSVSCTNLAIIPESIPEGKIKYLTTTTEPPKDGVAIFSRIVSPYSTLVIDGGQIIIPPGQSLLVYLGGFLPVVLDSAIIAFGWWEEIICEHFDYYC